MTAFFSYFLFDKFTANYLPKSGLPNISNNMSLLTCHPLALLIINFWAFVFGMPKWWRQNSRSKVPRGDITDATDSVNNVTWTRSHFNRSSSKLRPVLLNKHVISIRNSMWINNTLPASYYKSEKHESLHSLLHLRVNSSVDLSFSKAIGQGGGTTGNENLRRVVWDYLWYTGEEFCYQLMKKNASSNLCKRKAICVVRTMDNLLNWTVQHL